MTEILAAGDNSEDCLVSKHAPCLGKLFLIFHFLFQARVVDDHLTWP